MTSFRSAHLPGWILLLLAILAVPGTSCAQGVAVSITIAPPVLPVYTQPLCPGDGYLWTPGYWAWDPDYDDYYWVPGTWVEAPEVGFLWTPGYWGWNDGGFLWNAGYWGPNIGFYGGVDYGFGYIGTGFAGGYWQGNNFYYNTSVMNVNRTIIRNTYTKTVVNSMSTNRVSYNGGTGGLRARPTAEQEKYRSERHIPMTSAQTEHQRTASGDRSLRASVNHGRPPVAATAKPADFKTGAVAARGGGPSYTKTAANRGNEKNGNASRAAAKPSKEAATEHAKSARPGKNPAPATHAPVTHAPATHEGVAKTEPKAEPKASSKPAKSEHAATRPAEPKPAVAPRENQARTEPKPAKSEHATARPAEAKPAAAPHERMAKPEPKAPRPAVTEHAKTESPESRPSPAHAASAPRAEHQSEPKPVSKPAPAKEERKPPR